MGNEEIIFCKLYEDYLEFLDNKTDWTLIQTSRIARQLLVDGYPLLNKIKRKYRRIDEIYSYSYCAPKNNAILFLLLDVLFEPISHKDLIKTNREGFLKNPVMWYSDCIYSVHDFIKYTAHLLGGVHTGKAKNKKEQLFLSLANIEVNNLINAAIYQMSSIGYLLCNALKPFYLELTGNSIHIKKPSLGGYYIGGFQVNIN